MVATSLLLGGATRAIALPMAAEAPAQQVPEPGAATTAQTARYLYNFRGDGRGMNPDLRRAVEFTFQRSGAVAAGVSLQPPAPDSATRRGAVTTLFAARLSTPLAAAPRKWKENRMLQLGVVGFLAVITATLLLALSVAAVTLALVSRRPRAGKS